MISGSTLIRDNVTLVGVIDPDAYAASTVTTAWISAKDAAIYMGLVSAGDLGSSATLDAKIEQAQDGSGTGAKDVTGKAITQLTQAGTDSNKQATISLRQDELDIEGGFTHFRLSMTIGTATSDAAAYVFAANPRYGGSDAPELASVDEHVD